VRLGEIEPPQGQRVLVDAHVTPVDPTIYNPRLAAALVDPLMADVAWARVPVIGNATIVDELGSDIQGATVPAADASVEPSDLGVDARRIESIYAARGYFRARTLSWDTVELDAQRTRVEYLVREGEPTFVVEVLFEGLKLPANDPEAVVILTRIWGELPDLASVRVGDVWTEEAYLIGLVLIRRAFREAGFIDAEVEGDTYVSRDSPTAAVHYRVSHGPIARSSGTRTVIGAKIVPESRIAVRAQFEKGAILASSELRLAEQRIFDLGQFLFVQVRPKRVVEATSGLEGAEPAPPADNGVGAIYGASGDSRDTIKLVLPKTVPSTGDLTQLGRMTRLWTGVTDLEIEVQEAPEWAANAGFGARTDSTQLSLETPFSFNHRNLFNELVSFVAEARPALVFPQAFQSGSGEVRVGMNARMILTVPSFFEEYLKFNVTTSYRRDVTQAAGVEDFSGSLDWSRRFGRYFSARFGWNFTYSNFFDRSVFDLLTPEEALDTLDLRFRRTDRLAWLGASVAYDSRDGAFAAKRGIFASLALDVADTWLGSLAPFQRLTFEGRAYLTHRDFELLTVALRLRAGAVFSPSAYGTNESVRLRSGGQSSNRGFAANRMGDYLCIHDAAAGDVVNGGCSTQILDRLYVGGNYLFETNFELRLNFGTLGIVGFADIGNIWNRIGDIDFTDLNVTVGPGLRFETPIGPLRFDIGFLLGANPRTEFHIGLGQAF